MLEVEIKVRITEDEYNQISTKLTSLDFEYISKMKETDVYYNSPSKNYFESGEALRIRSSESLIDNKMHTYLTYKGKKVDTLSNTRVEHEVSVDSKENIEHIFHALDFTELFTVEKERYYYNHGSINVCIDSVKDLGYYIELEKIVATDNEKNSALVELFLLLNQLGINNDRLESQTYARLLFDKMGGTRGN